MEITQKGSISFINKLAIIEHGNSNLTHSIGERNKVSTNAEVGNNIDELVRQANELISRDYTGFKFVKHDILNEYYIQVVNAKDEIVYEIPSKKSLDFFAAFLEFNHIINKRV